MKTAQEWDKIAWQDHVVKYGGTRLFIEAIQLDAWKQGMTDAAAIAHKYEPDVLQYYVNYASTEIQVARDTKKKLLS